MAAYPPIPCGDADFRRIRLTGSLYVDKTRFLRKLERVRFAVLIRPRRFGKSCWISLLEHHYDRTRADAFDAVFRGTDVAREPTDERHRYVVLRFNSPPSTTRWSRWNATSRTTARTSSSMRWGVIRTCAAAT